MTKREIEEKAVAYEKTIVGSIENQFRSIFMMDADQLEALELALVNMTGKVLKLKAGVEG